MGWCSHFLLNKHQHGRLSFSIGSALYGQCVDFPKFSLCCNGTWLTWLLGWCSWLRLLLNDHHYGGLSFCIGFDLWDQWVGVPNSVLCWADTSMGHHSSAWELTYEISGLVFLTPCFIKQTPAWWTILQYGSWLAKRLGWCSQLHPVSNKHQHGGPFFSMGLDIKSLGWFT